MQASLKTTSLLQNLIRHHILFDGIGIAGLLLIFTTQRYSILYFIISVLSFMIGCLSRTGKWLPENLFSYVSSFVPLKMEIEDMKANKGMMAITFLLILVVPLHVLISLCIHETFFLFSVIFSLGFWVNCIWSDIMWYQLHPTIKHRKGGEKR